MADLSNNVPQYVVLHEEMLMWPRESGLQKRSGMAGSCFPPSLYTQETTVTFIRHSPLSRTVANGDGHIVRAYCSDTSLVMPPKATNSGIRQLSNGESVIPSSIRADGSVRKEMRVKAGYRPPEDVEVYKNRTAEAWKNRGKGGVPGADTSGPATPASTAANKNAKRREARKKAAAVGVIDGEDGGVNANGVAGEANAKTATDEREVVDPEAEKAKEARKLAKKLRQARDLQEKKEKGDELLPEQLAKVIKMSELIRQLDGLGFDAEGEMKAMTGDAAAKG